MSTPPHRPRRPLTVAALGVGCLALAAAPALGETIFWTITVTNAGETSVPVADVVVSDPQVADLAPAGGGAGDELAPGETLTWSGTGPSRPRTAACSATPRRWRCGPARRARATGTRPRPRHGLRRRVRGGVRPPDRRERPGAARPGPVPLHHARGHAAGPALCLPTAEASARVTGPAEMAAGEAARFTIAVGNAPGAAGARRAPLTVRLPMGFALATPAKAAALDDGAVRMSLGTLAARRSRSTSVALRADRTATGTQALRASVSARCGTARAKALVRVARAVENQVLSPVTG